MFFCFLPLIYTTSIKFFYLFIRLARMPTVAVKTKAVRVRTSAIKLRYIYDDFGHILMYPGMSLNHLQLSGSPLQVPLSRPGRVSSPEFKEWSEWSEGREGGQSWQPGVRHGWNVSRAKQWLNSKKYFIPRMFPVSEPVEKLEGKLQTTGEAKYVDDIPKGGRLDWLLEWCKDGKENKWLAKYVDL